MDLVARAQFFGGEHAAARIVDVLIGARLVQHDVAATHRVHALGQFVEQAFGVAAAVVQRAGGDVGDLVVEVEFVEDVLGAVAVVHIVVEDADARGTVLAERARRDHQAVERAEAVRVTVRCVVEPDTGAQALLPCARAWRTAASIAPEVYLSVAAILREVLPKRVPAVGRNGQQLGGMMTKPKDMKTPDGREVPPSWMFYVTTDELDAALERAKTGGARVLNGPMEVPGGQRIVQLMDPQGAAFALVTPPKP